MSSVFRSAGGAPIEVSASWTLAEQLAEVAHWLDQPANAAQVKDSILDVGFNTRLGTHVVVHGETIPVSFMQRLVAFNVELCLSIYPPLAEADKAAPPHGR